MGRRDGGTPRFSSVGSNPTVSLLGSPFFVHLLSPIYPLLHSHFCQMDRARGAWSGLGKPFFFCSPPRPPAAQRFFQGSAWGKYTQGWLRSLSFQSQPGVEWGSWVKRHLQGTIPRPLPCLGADRGGGGVGVFTGCCCPAPSTSVPGSANLV